MLRRNGGKTKRGGLVVGGCGSFVPVGPISPLIPFSPLGPCSPCSPLSPGSPGKPRITASPEFPLGPYDLHKKNLLSLLS